MSGRLSPRSHQIHLRILVRLAVRGDIFGNGAPQGGFFDLHGDLLAL